MLRSPLFRISPAVIASILVACGPGSGSLGLDGVKLRFAESAPLQLGSERTYTLEVQREGGLEGALDVSIGEPSLGFSFEPFDVPAGVNEVSVTVAISDGPPPGPANVPFRVRGPGATWNVSVPVQLVDVPEGIEPQVHFEQRSALPGQEVDVPVSVNRSNGFTAGFSVSTPIDGVVAQGVSSANFGYKTLDAVLRVRVGAGTAPGLREVPYQVMFGGAYGSQAHVVHGTFTLEVLEPEAG